VQEDGGRKIGEAKNAERSGAFFFSSIYLLIYLLITLFKTPPYFEQAKRSRVFKTGGYFEQARLVCLFKIPICFEQARIGKR